MTPELRWQKLRPTATIRARLGQALADLNRERGVELHLIRHPLGKIIAFPTPGLWFVHATAGGRPPQFWTLAVAIGPVSATLVPSHDPLDFDRCCAHLGIHAETAQQQFRQFLFPDAARPVAMPVPGAL